MSNSRIAVVTGGSKGIGCAISSALAREGYHVYVNYRSSEASAVALCNEITEEGYLATPIQFDVSKSNEVSEAFEKITSESGGVDVLVSNAGISADSLLLRVKDEDIDSVIATNLKGPMYCARSAIKTMMKRPNGRIIFISSVVGQMGNAGQTVYSATKSGIHGMTKSIAREVASRGITVNSIAPGFVKTDMTEKLSDAVKEAMLKNIPLGRYAEPKEIAQVVKFLVSEDASYITGQIISVNGGMYL